MSEGLHRLFFKRLDTTPPSGTIEFFDAFVPKLGAGQHTITVHHVVAAPTGPSPEYQASQSFIVEAPQFRLDPVVVGSTSPADGIAEVLGHQLPNVVLHDPSLPWERTLVPGTQPSPTDPMPWMALLLFAEGEIYLQPGTSSPLITSTVQELLADSDTVLKPQLKGHVLADQMTLECESILIPGTSWPLLPATTDLRYLAHCRTTSVPDEDASLVSVLLANRLPLPGAGVPLRYYAHLVSLEGFADYLSPGGKPLPLKPDGGPVDVQLASLASWTFTSVPEAGLSFEVLMQGLIASEVESPVLRLPIPGNSQPPAPVQQRLNQGFVPLALQSASGEESFAWYRGPLVPVVPQPVTAVGDPAVPVLDARSADALMIYLADEGLFDLSYAAAWTMGRQLGLANAGFAKALSQYRQRAVAALHTMARHLRVPMTAPATPAASLQHRAGARALTAKIAGGQARHWNEALGAIALSPVSPRTRVGSTHRPARRSVAPHSLLQQPGVVEALAEHLSEAADPVIEWLTQLANLVPVPFSSLVADPRMLPTESVRFFYVDQTWLDALQAGALSLAAHTQLDAAVMAAQADGLRAEVRRRQARTLRRSFGNRSADGSDTPPLRMTGVLVRSAMIAGWPTMAIGASAAGTPLDVVRDATLAPSVRLLLFSGVPDTITFAQPYQGLRFGVEDNGVKPRYVTAGQNIGQEIPGIPTVPPGGYTQFLKDYCRTASGSVVDVAQLATALKAATGADASFRSGDFAIQMVLAPEMQQFTATATGARR